jgi:hypothetical protein
MQDRVNKLLFEVTKLNEFQLGQKNDLIGIINKLVLATKQSANPAELDKKLNTVLEFYRYYEKGIPMEDTIVYNEFKQKLLKLAKDNSISLK